jgi:hypothetical protein
MSIVGLIKTSISDEGQFKRQPQITSVRVSDIVLDEKHSRFKEVGEWNGIGTIFWVAVEQKEATLNSNNKAKPVFSNIKQYPLINEIVYLISLPIPTTQENNLDSNDYYIASINVWNSQHHNALPTGSSNTTSTSTTSPPPSRPANKINLGKTFKEKDKIFPLQPYEGDIIYEGRWGNSIRLGSTIKKSDQLPNTWSSTGGDGDPIIYIRNGQDPKNNKDSWIPVAEDINKELSSIILTSTQTILLNAAYSKYESYASSPPKSPDKFGGKQIILNSGRLLFNANEDHILLTSKNTISFGSVKGFNFDTDNNFIVKSKEIKLGSKEATEPLLLGNETVALLKDLVNTISQALKPLETIAGLPPGVPFLPTNSANIAARQKLASISRELQKDKSKILSKQNKTL